MEKINHCNQSNHYDYLSNKPVLNIMSHVDKYFCINSRETPLEKLPLVVVAVLLVQKSHEILLETLNEIVTEFLIARKFHEILHHYTTVSPNTRGMGKFCDFR